MAFEDGKKDGTEREGDEEETVIWVLFFTCVDASLDPLCRCGVEGAVAGFFCGLSSQFGLVKDCVWWAVCLLGVIAGRNVDATVSCDSFLHDDRDSVRY